MVLVVAARQGFPGVVAVVLWLMRCGCLWCLSKQWRLAGLMPCWLSLGSSHIDSGLTFVLNEPVIGLDFGRC
ncbi:hypothetical protein COO60DRAFT_415330 [Scenedesmus sp. NREL 46B-D3]|nr:hypothetical protein COO60DRAFT_415330 [Scenedesmus sp. NREL 46B-D3]